MRKPTWLACLLAAGFALHASAQQLSPIEKKITDAVNKAMPETLAELEALVNVNSGSLNAKGVRASGELVSAELKKLGFTTEWIDMPDSLKNAGHLVGTRKGKNGKKLLLLGHLDTVFEPDMPANPFRVLNDSTITGQGILDDKGGVSVILAALQALAKVDALKEVTITVYLTGDEELAGAPASVTRADLVKRSKAHDVALSFEEGKPERIVTGRRGSDTYRLATYGTQAHSSGVFYEPGYGSVYEAARILDSFRTLLPKEPFLTTNPGVITGGTTLNDKGDHTEVYGKTNIIAANTTVAGDIRFITEKQRYAVREQMKAIVENGSLAGTHASISFKDGIPSMEPTAANKELAAALNKVNLELGMGQITEDDPMKRGAGDISFIASNLPCLDGLGPSGQGSHAPGETINSKELPLLIQRAAIFIYRLTR